MIYPRVCAVCGDSLVEGEREICLKCLATLPRTGIHGQPFNTIHKRLASPGIPVERAGAWFYYLRKNPFAAIIHDAKYRGMSRLALNCGEIYAREIAPDGFFDGVDLLLPVPLHRGKLRKRGYNQAEEIAKGVSQATGIPVGTNLIAVRGHSTQTRKNAWSRWKNTRNIYKIQRPEELVGKHVLVIDDVVTTGATILSCLEALHRAEPSVRTSVLTLAATHLQ